ncbi:MAG: 1-deoxy-D-xylulose-5-phosphate synthase [Candidatus Desulfovibrio kirbyi]|jgi:1-deoxy-D-xylulose-5-phosphate synthase|uniref:1-deoxy-D-xylulose-5-phosphate synthase n=1 Tax=Candidatus Desulfovibrio kirbyi TaxID=2696086 RepID=A0A6L2R538_9BACT|nr:1-deoxy-D-xylulose-5-phosphate synthase [Desulfovibrio sp.]GFH62681.1 MAG: 1-deoxy-D-xylulose-5-phosphate synthase [Candidatus Desulfovibrio kirbyi]
MEQGSSADRLLDGIVDPSQIAALSEAQLAVLAGEVRQRIIAVVARNGGHLASSLGVVELTLALLAVFNLHNDRLIWDVGHQSYAYKLLTGRASDFHTLRVLGGLSGFPRMSESPFDHFGVGHSSTSISAALGMAVARDFAGGNNYVLAVIGDGSLTGGEALEGLNLAGNMGRRLIVVLNDNEMSISSNVGALSLFLSRALSRRWVRQARKDVLKFLRSVPRIGQKLALYAMRGEWSFKSFFTPGMLFEALRFTYIGPVDGHDITALKQNLQTAAAVEDGPVLLHVRTTKGKGYEPAEEKPTLYHGVGLFAPETGMPASVTGKPPSFTSVFGATLVELARDDNRIFAITAAMPEGTGTSLFRERFPERFVDAGICEQHAVTFAAGLATQGYRPVVAVYSTFLQRAYDQILHDVCLQNLPVTFCIDRAGLVGEDGATHHGAFDIAYLRHIPQLRLLAPRDEDMLRHCLSTAIGGGVPCAVRYPRGDGFGVPLEGAPRMLAPGVGKMLRQGEKVAIIAVGHCVYPALEAASRTEQELGFTPAVFDPVWLKPLPEEQLADIARQYRRIVFVEEGVLAGGFSSAVLEFFTDSGLLRSHGLQRLGLPDSFVEHGSQAELRELVGLCSANIVTAVKRATLF